MRIDIEGFRLLCRGLPPRISRQRESQIRERLFSAECRDKLPRTSEVCTGLPLDSKGLFPFFSKPAEYQRGTET
jgi:hypothetical protein